MLKAVRDVSQLTEGEKQEAIALTMAGLGQAEIEIVASYTAPISWAVKMPSGLPRMKGGSVFFLDTGEAVFAVTACHVVSEFFKDAEKQETAISIAADGKRPMRIPLQDRIIDMCPEIDIATFRAHPNELKYFEKKPIRGHVSVWPPKLAQVHGPTTYCGYPGVGRRVLQGGISFGIVSMGGLVTSSHETLISIQIERENIVRILGEDEMPEDFNFGGISGGPLIAIIQSETMRTWKPAGVIISGPNPGDNNEQDYISGFEIIRARPIHFVNADGTLDRARWQQANIR